MSKMALAHIPSIVPAESERADENLIDETFPEKRICISM
jgi:hypothetical protein